MRRLFTSSASTRRRAAGSASETSDDESLAIASAGGAHLGALGALGILEVSASESSSADDEPLCIVGMDVLAATMNSFSRYAASPLEVRGASRVDCGAEAVGVERAGLGEALDDVALPLAPALRPVPLQRVVPR